MDKEFQDKIDNFLLHESEMEQNCKEEFIREIGKNPAKKEQYEFTLNVKKAIDSRESKRDVLANFHKKYLADKNREKSLRLFKRIIIGGSSVAAIFIVGVFLVRPLYWDTNEPKLKSPVFSNEKPVKSETSTKAESENNMNCLSDSIDIDSISDNDKPQESFDNELSWDKLQ